MKHITKRKAKLYFQRGIPTRLRPIAGKSSFSMPLGLDAATATEEEKLHARIEAQRMYELYLKTLENSSVDAFADNEIEALAADVLRRNRVNPGQYAKHMLGPKLQDNDPELANIPFELTGKDYATIAVPEYFNLMQKLRDEGALEVTRNEAGDADVYTLTRQLSAQEEAVKRAWEAVQKVGNQKPKTIRSLWEGYLQQRRKIDLTSPKNREHKRFISRFEKFMRFCPDVIINDTTPKLIQHSLEEMVATEERRGMAPNTVRRDLNETVAAINWAIKKYTLGWPSITMPLIDDNPNYIAKEKDVLLTSEQVQLYNAAVDADTPLAAALLVMLHCGAMATEIARLRIDEDLHLDHPLFPYISMQGGRNRATKTTARLRFVPVVFGLDLIKRRLPEAIEILAGVKEPSSKLNVEFKKLLSENNSKKYTGHCLRHTFKMQTTNKLMSPEISYAIGGWSGGWINKVANQYGTAAFGENEQLQTLNKELARVFSAVVEADKQRQAVHSNVVVFNGDKNR